MARFVVLLFVIAIAAACSAGQAPSGGDPGSPLTSPSAMASQMPATASPKGSEAPSTAPSDPPAQLGPGVSVATVADRVRVRSAPAVSDTSLKYEPVLPLGTGLHIVEGPVAADGYRWFRVVPLDFELREPGGAGATDGWVAAGSREGDAWLALTRPDCPSAPADVASLRLGFGERLACFGGVPITFQARLAECDCDVDGPFFEPGWFASWQLALVDPDASTNPVDLDRAVFLALDPDGDYPDPLPVDALVEVTGVFDHPAARNCLAGDMDQEPNEPSLWCRFQFAVTSLRPV